MKKYTAHAGNSLQTPSIGMYKALHMWIELLIIYEIKKYTSAVHKDQCMHGIDSSINYV